MNTAVLLLSTRSEFHIIEKCSVCVWGGGGAGCMCVGVGVGEACVRACPVCEHSNITQIFSLECLVPEVTE